MTKLRTIKKPARKGKIPRKVIKKAVKNCNNNNKTKPSAYSDFVDLITIVASATVSAIGILVIVIITMKIFYCVMNLSVV